MTSNSQGQSVPAPELTVSSYIFSDTCTIKVNTSMNGAVVLRETTFGGTVFFRESPSELTVTETTTLRFKVSHPDYADSPVTRVRVYKKSDVEAELLGDYGSLVDGVKAGLNSQSKEWLTFNEDKAVIHFKAEKSIQEVEICSLLDKEENTFPPKKVALYAYLKNGEKVHIRTSNTIGLFESDKEYFSHTLRLLGKPKLKKILRKTEHFILEITPHAKKGERKSLKIDEILFR